MKFTIESIMSDHPKLWQEIQQIPMEKLSALIELMNGESLEPAGRETASKQLDKEDALISSLRLDYLMPIESVKAGKGNRKSHVIAANDLRELLSNRDSQKKRIKGENAREQEQRTEKDLKRALDRYGLNWTLKRIKAVNRKGLAKQNRDRLENCNHCNYEQLASDLFYGGCVKCGGFNDN